MKKAGAGVAVAASLGVSAYMLYCKLFTKPQRHQTPEADVKDEDLLEEIEKGLECLQRDLEELDVFKAYAQECVAPRCQPMVLLIGNHSSGKSTFINNLCEGRIQEVGTAPTDDAFTVIQNGDIDLNEDGYTAISKCEGSCLGFEGLRSFGHSFIQHFRLKIRKLGANAKLPDGVVVVDSPGTIDTPTPECGREYDFTKVVRWFVRRSAVILLFFDPANPGTTGETLEILNETLLDNSHKLLLVLNKVDTLDNVGDFARVYGNLCWNLSKVLRVKDLPRIYTTYSETSASGGKLPESKLPLLEFQQAREQVLSEIELAPERHHDNAATTMEEVAKKLQMLARVHGTLPIYPPRLVSGTVTVALIAYATWQSDIVSQNGPPPSLWKVGLLSGLLALGAASLCVDPNKISEATLEKNFAKTYREQLRNKQDVDTRARWAEVKSQLLSQGQNGDTDFFFKIRAYFTDFETPLKKVLDSDLPRIRALVNRRRRIIASVASK